MVQSSIKAQIPNAITVLRILLVIPIIVLAAISWETVAYTMTVTNFTVAITWKNVVLFILFAVASFSDWLDGWLSRKYHWISDFGKIMDPIADKVLINSILIILAVQNITNFVFVVLFIARDVIVDALRMYIASHNIIIAASFFGKLKTVLQMVAIICLLLLGTGDASLSWWYWAVQQMPLYLALLASLFSGGKYTYDFISRMPKNK